MKFSFAEINNAREILELPEKASITTIRKNYHRLLRRWHPDTCDNEQLLCQEKTQDLTSAYQLLLNYCNAYEFSFSEEAIGKNPSAEEWWLNRFGNAPWWG